MICAAVMCDLYMRDQRLAKWPTVGSCFGPVTISMKYKWFYIDSYWFIVVYIGLCALLYEFIG